MWMKIIGCVALAIYFNCDVICGNGTPYKPHHDVEPADNIKISKNITIHRHGFGRFLGLLKLLKGLHHKRQVYNPYVISRLWRASFEFEVNPHPIPIYGHEMNSNIYFPTDIGGITGGGVISNNKPSNSGLGSNSIDSIFHFGNNEQQSSVTIGGSNQITKGERDEIPIGQNQVIQKESFDTVIANDTKNEIAGKSERVLRHAIHGRFDDESDVEETTIDSSLLTTEESETGDTTMTQTTLPTESTISQTIGSTESSFTQTIGSTESSFTPTIGSTESLIPQTTVLEETSIYPTTDLTNHYTEPVTGARPESSSIGSMINEPSMSSTTALPSEWLGYYGSGIHKPEFIQSIEFTTNYPPQLVTEDIRYVTYGPPFKPSRPDYTANAYPYSTNFFNALRYFRR